MKIRKAEIELKFTGLVLATMPSNDAALAFVNAKRVKEGGQEVPKEEIEQADEGAQYTQVVFRRTKDGKPFVDEHIIKGMLRETFRRYGESKLLKGLWMRIFTTPYQLIFEDYGDKILSESRAFSADTMMGKRSIVNVHEALLEPTLKFTLEIHDSDEKMKDILFIKERLEYAGRYIGFGAGRTKSGLEHAYGMFEVKKFSELSEAK